MLFTSPQQTHLALNLNLIWMVALMSETASKETQKQWQGSGNNSNFNILYLSPLPINVNPQFQDFCTNTATHWNASSWKLLVLANTSLRQNFRPVTVVTYDPVFLQVLSTTYLVAYTYLQSSCRALHNSWFKIHTKYLVLKWKVHNGYKSSKLWLQFLSL